MLKKYLPLLDNFKGKKILVIGDVMLDEYLEGEVERISPEAPVPIVVIKEHRYKLGGAANVAHNVKTLGAIPFLIGITGYDAEAEVFKKLLDEKEISTASLIQENERKTTTKTRILAYEQQVVRVDRETTKEISKETEAKILQEVKKQLAEIDAIIFQDYEKGMLTQQICETIIKRAKERNIPTFVDPKKNFMKYKEVTLFKPNYRELLSMTKEEDMENACKSVFEKINPSIIFVTKGKEGIYIAEKGNKIMQIQTKAKEVYDVTGAGDTVISVIALSMINKIPLEITAQIANIAASISIKEQGNVAVSLEKLQKEIAQELE